MTENSDPGDTRTRYEQKTADLVGRRLIEVRYWDVHSFSDKPRVWDYGDWHHAVMGVELGTDQGVASVTWTDAFRLPCDLNSMRGQCGWSRLNWRGLAPMPSASLICANRNAVA
jgi:hypothetical protein